MRNLGRKQKEVSSGLGLRSTGKLRKLSLNYFGKLALEKSKSDRMQAWRGGRRSMRWPLLSLLFRIGTA